MASPGGNATRILITLPSLGLEFGGPAVKARKLAHFLREAGEDVTVLGVGEHAGYMGLHELARFHSTPIPTGLRPIARAVGSADLVHVIGYRDPVGTAAAIFAWRSGVPFVIEPSGMYRRRLRSRVIKAFFDGLVGRRLVRAAALVVATSDLEARELKEDGIAPERIRIRPNGVSFDELDPEHDRGEFRRSHGIPSDAPLILSLGRITAKKGLVDMARALKPLHGVWGAIVGPDDRDGTVERLLAERGRLGLEDRLVIVPRGFWGGEKAAALCDADAFCLASASENFGTAAVEAAAVGLPVVLSNKCGVAEWLDPAGCRIVPYGDVNGLTAALGAVLDGGGARAAAAAAATRVREELDWRSIAEQQAAIYRSVLIPAPSLPAPERPLRIVLTVPSLDPAFGGPVVKAQALAAALRENDCTVDVIGAGRATWAIGLPVIGRFHGTPIPSRLRPLRDLIRRADVVHIIGYRDPIGTYAAFTARRYRIPYVVEPVGMVPRRLRSFHLKAVYDSRIGRSVLAAAARVVATSSAELGDMEASGLPPEKLVLRPNGINTRSLLPLPPRGRLRLRMGILGSAPVVAYVGRIAAIKGLPYLVEAISRLESVVGVIAGPDEHDGTLESIMQLRDRLALDGRLLVLSQGVWGADLRQFFADVDVICLVSQNESFGNAAAEAAAVGVPVVVTNTCGVAEWLDVSSTRIVSYGSVDELAHAIGEVTRQPLIRRRARAAAEGFRRTLDWSGVAMAQVRLYREVAGARL